MRPRGETRAGQEPLLQAQMVGAPPGQIRRRRAVGAGHDRIRQRRIRDSLLDEIGAVQPVPFEAAGHAERAEVRAVVIGLDKSAWQRTRKVDCVVD